MIQHIFSVYDMKAFAFIPPFTMPTPEMAVRTFQNCANDETHMFCKNPLDFNLFQVGEFDDSNGEITKIDPAINLGLAQSYKKGK